MDGAPEPGRPVRLSGGIQGCQAAFVRRCGAQADAAVGGRYPGPPGPSSWDGQGSFVAGSHHRSSAVVRSGDVRWIRGRRKVLDEYQTVVHDGEAVQATAPGSPGSRSSTTVTA